MKIFILLAGIILTSIIASGQKKSVDDLAKLFTLNRTGSFVLGREIRDYTISKVEVLPCTLRVYYHLAVSDEFESWKADYIMEIPVKEIEGIYDQHPKDGGLVLQAGDYVFTTKKLIDGTFQTSANEGVFPVVFDKGNKDVVEEAKKTITQVVKNCGGKVKHGSKK